MAVSVGEALEGNAVVSVPRVPLVGLSLTWRSTLTSASLLTSVVVCFDGLTVHVVVAVALGKVIPAALLEIDDGVSPASADKLGLAPFQGLTFGNQRLPSCRHNDILTGCHRSTSPVPVEHGWGQWSGNAKADKLTKMSCQ